MFSNTYVEALVNVEVGVHVALVSAVDAAGHARPGLLEGQNTLDVVSVQLFARDGVDDGGLNAEERKRGTTRLGGGDTSKRGDDVGAGLCLPVGLTTG